MRKGRFFSLLLICLVAFFALGLQDAAAAKSKKKQRPAVDRSAEIVIEASTGYILAEKNANKRLYPASLTKMMTLYMAFDALESGTLSKNKRIPVSKHAAGQEPSSLGLRAGESIRVEDAILGIVTKSANDAAAALGEALGGTETRFARKMTQKAKELGMQNTRFVNASGLFHPEQVTTARDMSILAQALMRDHPRHYRYFSTMSFSYRGKTYVNHNRLMNTYRGMDGLKTGYVYASGFNLAASATRNGTRLIGVVFGGKTAGSRNQTMARLLDKGFERVADVRVAYAIQQSPKTFAAYRDPAKRIASVKPAEVVFENPGASVPQFNSMGLRVDQGDADLDDIKPAAGDFVSEFQPRPVNKKAETARSIHDVVRDASRNATGFNARGEWAVQIGAFASHAAGLSALESAKETLPDVLRGRKAIVPLMTNRGMIYRARISGLNQREAARACEVLKGNCLVLAVD